MGGGDSTFAVGSFPLQEVEPGAIPEVEPGRECDYNLGDVILGVSVIGEGCKCDGVRLEDRLPVIVTHGFCHLLGYRHDTAPQRQQV